MRRFRSLLSLALLWSACSACGGAEVTPTPTPVVTAPASDPHAGHVFGDRALVTVLVRANRWPETQSALRTFFGTEMPMPRELQRLLDAQSFAEWLQVESRTWAGIARELPGLDPDRPIVVRLWEPPETGLAGAVDVAMGDGSVPTVRHVVALPTRQPEQLADVLIERMERCERREGPGRGLRCLEFRHVRLEPSNDVLFVVLNDPSEVIEGLRSTAALPRTLRWATEVDAPVAVFGRGSAVRSAGAHIAAGTIAQALQGASEEYRPPMRQMGLSEMTGMYLRTGEYTRELRDVAFALRTDETASIVWAGELTPVGAAAVAAGMEGATATPAPSAEPGFALRTSLSFEAAMQAAEIPHGFHGAVEASDAAEAFQSCGWFCYLQTMASPLGYGRLAARVGLWGDGAEQPLPSVDPSLPAGRWDLTVDVAAVGERMGDRSLVRFAQHLPTVFVRSQFDGDSWLGTVSPNERLDFVPLPGTNGTSPAPPSPEAVACAERLGMQTQQVLRLAANMDPTANTREALAEVRGRALSIECDLSHLSIAADVEGYRRALSVIEASEPEAPPPARN